MARHDRRDFLRSGTLTAAALGAASGPALGAADNADDAPDRGPDLVLLNGVVYTMDDRRPKAEALAVRHGRFVAVGKTADIRKLVTRATKVIDAANMTVVPGFIDGAGYLEPIAHGTGSFGHHHTVVREPRRDPGASASVCEGAVTLDQGVYACAVAFALSPPCSRSATSPP